METNFKRDNEIVSYGGGVEVENIVKRDKQAHLVWRWGEGGEYFQMINLIVLHEPRLPKKQSAVRVETVLCFHFPCLSDHMSKMF